MLMAELLKLSGVQVSHDPDAVFDWIRREVPLYSGVDHDGVGSLGATPAQPV